MSNPYHYTRFRWMRPLDLDAASRELGVDFTVEKKPRPRDDVELTLYADQRDEIVARADTLAVIMTSLRAVLFQRESKPFTGRDLRLRAWVFRSFDKTTPTPFPWGMDVSAPSCLEGLQRSACSSTKRQSGWAKDATATIRRQIELLRCALC